ncbi:MAG: S-methyl-5'-thioadenosine phosphorylase, partial [Planctomycetota bacterium]|nr:S-methyl-5'-thioadenosine phosphorylase [Planctomycetota bacterium]
DYDCWHPQWGDVTVERVLDILGKNVAMARDVIREAVRTIPTDRSCKCPTALRSAIITDRAAIPEKLRKDLDLLIGKYL